MGHLSIGQKRKKKNICQVKKTYRAFMANMVVMIECIVIHKRTTIRNGGSNGDWCNDVGNMIQCHN